MDILISLLTIFIFIIPLFFHFIRKKSPSLHKKSKISKREKKKHLKANRYFYLSLKYHEEKNYKKAIQYCKKCLLLNSHHIEAHNNMGVNLGKLGNISSEINFYKKTLLLNDKHINAHINLSNAYVKLAHLKKKKRNLFYTKAIHYYKKVIDLDHQNKEAYLCIIRLYKSLGQLATAQQYIHRLKILEYFK